jgi:hypothetical protein
MYWWHQRLAGGPLKHRRDAGAPKIINLKNLT